MKKIYVTILLIFTQIQLFAACVSFSSGDWGDSSTWICGGSLCVPPTCGDTIIITTGHTVAIRNQQDYSNCNSPIFIVVEGQKFFLN